MKIPPAVDDLMWLVAENQDASAVEAFVNRYPEFRGEMMRRLRVVADLKRARGPAATMIPPMLLTKSPRTFGASRSPWAISGVALALTAGIAFAVWRMQPPPPVPLAVQPKIEMFEPTVQKPVEAIPEPVESQRPTKPEPSAPVAPGQQLLTMRMVDLKFSEAVTALASAGKLQIELAPGGDDMNVRFSCKDEPAGTALVRLCQQSGYTAFEQQPGTYLIVPAVDPNSSTISPPADVPPLDDRPRIER